MTFNPMVYFGQENIFLRTETVIRKVAEGQHVRDSRLQYDDNFQFELGCCICRHIYREHAGHEENWARVQITANGCRCCATAKVVPVKLLHVERKVEVRYMWPE